jgi:hypothetical protein
MPKARMLTGGIVEPRAGGAGAVVAYVAVSGGPQGSRLFRVDGPAGAPLVHELSPETTIDLQHFAREMERELLPMLEEARRSGGVAAMTTPKPAWIAGVVRAFLKESEGFDVE